MRRKVLTAVLPLLFAFAALSQGNQWQDPTVNQTNRLPMHTTFFAYESRQAADLNKKENSDRFISLNGKWQFNWVKNADQRPTNFYAADYNDSAWGTMSVPGIWELNGYGDPIYVNTGYAWRNQFKSDPPKIPIENNHVGSYRREIDIPESWSGQQVIAHFGSVTSNIYLWVNGKFVGYSEDSKLETEFDITPFLKKGKNLIAFQVFRWCDGTYLEDQDFLRLSGVARDCYIYARDQRHVSNVQLVAGLKDSYKNGVLDIALDFSAKSKGCKAAIELLDNTGKSVATAEIASNGAAGAKSTINVENVKQWSSEIPTLYTLMISLKDSKGSIIEVIPQKIGFRSVEIKDGQLLVNGKAILIKGVNRHETDPSTGYVISEERMKQDIRVLKEFNINAVRTCHYPSSSRWYELCDIYGIYLVAEANVESHGMGYGDGTLAKNPLYEKAHLERNSRNVMRNFNHPSIIVWSMGNEAGNGPNFENCYKWIKNYDSSRPVQYEQAHGGDNTDIYCPMYASYEGCEKYLSGNPSKPLIQCEYAHAMGNSMGGFKEYWDLIRRSPRYQGGFIWDFADQSLRMTSDKGVSYYAYGGDFNRYDASDGNFMDNGVFSPDRKPNPHAFEVRYFYQSIWSFDAGLADGKIKILNENFFKDISNYSLYWTILHNGKPIRSGSVDNLPSIAPQSEGELKLPFTAKELPTEGELLLNLDYRLRSPENVLPAGHSSASQQLVIRPFTGNKVDIAIAKADRFNPKGEVSITNNDRNFLIISSPYFKVEFERRRGMLAKYDVNGVEYMENGAVLEPNFWRAPTDNDFGANLQQKNRMWYRPALELKSLNANIVEGVATVRAEYVMKDVLATLTINYQINNVGEMVVEQSIKTDPSVEAPNMFRFGMRMQMPEKFDRILYYGRGPVENYADRKSSEFLGQYAQTVAEQFHPYIRPQENGTKSDIRWWKQYDADGNALMFTSNDPFSASALNYSQESLDDGMHKRNTHSELIERDSKVYISLDKLQSGVACVNSWGALPLPEYRVPYKDYTFTLKITPVKVLP